MKVYRAALLLLVLNSTNATSTNSLEKKKQEIKVRLEDDGFWMRFLQGGGGSVSMPPSGAPVRIIPLPTAIPTSVPSTPFPSPDGAPTGTPSTMTVAPVTGMPIAPVTSMPIATSAIPTTGSPVVPSLTASPVVPTTATPTTTPPVTMEPTKAPTLSPVVPTPATTRPSISRAPVTDSPTTSATMAPTTDAPTMAPATDAPTMAPISDAPVTLAPTSSAPVTEAPTTSAPVTEAPVTDAPTSTPTAAPVTNAPTLAPTVFPTTAAPVVQGPSTFGEVFIATASDAMQGDLFGWAVDVANATAVITSVSDDNNGDGSGSAYIFANANGVWTQQQILVPMDGAPQDQFGFAAATDGTTIVIAANLDDDRGSGSGSAYVFEFLNNMWMETAKLVPNDGEAAENFGFDVDVDGNTIVVSARADDDEGETSGSVYIFEKENGVWTETDTFSAGDTGPGDFFGTSVALDGDTLIVGAYRDDDMAPNSGSAYAFTRMGTSFMQTAKLRASDASDGDQFGQSVTVDGDIAVVGVPLDSDIDSNQGSAYVFMRTGMMWTQIQKLTASDGARDDRFGFVVDIDGDNILVTAQTDDVSAGSAYIFQRQPSGMWTELTKLVASDRRQIDQFGFSGAISGSTVLIGAPSNDDAGSSSGSAYFFDEFAPVVPVMP